MATASNGERASDALRPPAFTRAISYEERAQLLERSVDGEYVWGRDDFVAVISEAWSLKALWKIKVCKVLGKPQCSKNCPFHFLIIGSCSKQMNEFLYQKNTSVFLFFFFFWAQITGIFGPSLLDIISNNNGQQWQHKNIGGIFSLFWKKSFAFCVS